MKKSILFGMMFLFIASAAFSLPAVTYNKQKAIVDSNPAKQMKRISSVAVVRDMKTGWNLGNTLEATGTNGMGSETSWGQPKTSQIMIELLADYGMKTIRIPVSWSNHLIDKNYTIDPKWMARVKEVVDWAIECDMYVVINSHHDCYNSPKKMPKGKGYYPNSVNYDESAAFLTNIWTQIGNAFNESYDEHLIFETMNEPRLVGTNYEWWNNISSSEYKDASETLNKLNQVALDAIRATGKNNSERFVIVPGLRAAVDSVMANEFKVPEDTAKDKLIVSVHMYTPYKFAMEAPGVSNFVDAHRAQLESEFKQLNNKFVSKGVGIFVGEYGATNKGNDDARAAWFHAFLSLAKKYNAVCCLWDNGQGDASTSAGEHFGYYNRKQGTWFNDDFIEIINQETK